jgi:peptide/nickel transport system permease protein
VSAVPHPSRPISGYAGLVRSNPGASICVAIIVIAALAAITAPLIAPYSPTAVDLEHALSGPSAQHLLGTDNLGRDILSRLIWGTRPSLLGPLLVVVIAGTTATSLALAAAWRGGIMDQVISSAFDITLSFPGILLAIGAVAVFGIGLTAPVIALGVAYTPYIGRVARGAALRERRLAYVDALYVQGCSGLRTTLGHILPNIGPLILAQATLAFGWATIDLAAISFLGLGEQPPSADWGLTVSQGEPQILNHQPAQALYPGIALVLVVVAVTMLGRRLAQRSEEPQ